MEWESMPQPRVRSRKMSKMVKCKLCNMVFSKKSNLNAHLKIHTGLKQYSCTVPGCGKAFAKRWNMQHHVSRVHNKEKTFLCDRCDEKFYLKKELTTHKLAAHGIARPEKKFKCNCCTPPRCFALQAGLTRHTRSMEHGSQYGRNSNRRGGGPVLRHPVRIVATQEVPPSVNPAHASVITKPSIPPPLTNTGGKFGRIERANKRRKKTTTAQAGDRPSRGRKVPSPLLIPPPHGSVDPLLEVVNMIRSGKDVHMPVLNCSPQDDLSPVVDSARSKDGQSCFDFDMNSFDQVDIDHCITGEATVACHGCDNTLRLYFGECVQCTVCGSEVYAADPIAPTTPVLPVAPVQEVLLKAAPVDDPETVIENSFSNAGAIPRAANILPKDVVRKLLTSPKKAIKIKVPKATSLKGLLKSLVGAPAQTAVPPLDHVSRHPISSKKPRTTLALCKAAPEPEGSTPLPPSKSPATTLLPPPVGSLPVAAGTKCLLPAHVFPFSVGSQNLFPAIIGSNDGLVSGLTNLASASGVSMGTLYPSASMRPVPLLSNVAISSPPMKQPRTMVAPVPVLPDASVSSVPGVSPGVHLPSPALNAQSSSLKPRPQPILQSKPGTSLHAKCQPRLTLPPTAIKDFATLRAIRRSPTLSTRGLSRAGPPPTSVITSGSTRVALDSARLKNLVAPAPTCKVSVGPATSMPALEKIEEPSLTSYPSATPPMHSSGAQAPALYQPTFGEYMREFKIALAAEQCFSVPRDWSLFSSGKEVAERILGLPAAIPFELSADKLLSPSRPGS